MANALTYDQAVLQLQQIVSDLEKADILSMEDYKKKADEAKRLLDFCQAQLNLLRQQD